MMYTFKDTIGYPEERAPLPSEALSINGIYIEDEINGYRTLNVTGRESMTRELVELTTSRVDGSRLLSHRLKERTITIKYQMTASTASEFREKFNMLNKLINVEEATLIFADETDKYFIGTISDMEAPEPGCLNVTGSFSFLCSDPLKYSVEEKTQTVQVSGAETEGLAITYNGTYPVYPTFEITSGGNNASVGITITHPDASSARLTFGDEQEADTVSYALDETLIGKSNNGEFRDGELSNWELNAAPKVYYPYGNTEWLGGESAEGLNGTAKLLKLSREPNARFIVLDDPGTGDGSRPWRGVTLRREIPRNSEGGLNWWYVYYRACMCIGQANQVGVSEILVTDEDGEILAGLMIDKNNTSLEAWQYLYIGGTLASAEKGRVDDIASVNKLFHTSKGWKDLGIEVSSSTSSDKKVNRCFYNVGYGNVYYDKAGFSNIRGRTPKYIVLVLMKLPNYDPVSIMGFRALTVRDRNVGKVDDVPNTFDANTVLIANCSAAEVRTKNKDDDSNGILTPRLGAIGNEWEIATIEPGSNSLNINQSPWATSTSEVKIRYREAYL